MNIFSLFHYISKNTEEMISLLGGFEEGSEKKQEQETITYVKTYPRFKPVKLPLTQVINTTLSEVIHARTSGRLFDQKITIDQLSSILYFSLGSKTINPLQNDKDERMYPSAGRLFPVESYLFFFESVDNLSEGIYHYEPHSHTITLIKKIIFDEKIMDRLVMYDFAKNAKCAVVFTSVFERVTKKYGERGYRFALLEAGCMSHNITLTATALSVESLHMGGLIDSTAEELLGIDGTYESVVHSVFLG